MTQVNPQPAEPGVAAQVTAKMRDFVSAFADLLRLPRAFWFINLAFMVDSMSYFGVLTLMTAYIHADLGFSDARAGIMVSVFTGFVTLFMIGVGGLAERLGVRRGLLVALSFCLIGRIVYSSAGHTTIAWAGMVVLIAGLVLMALGEGILQPLTYAGIKQYTDEKTSSMGYGLIYAIMNLGIVLIGLISPLIRVPIDDIHEARAAGEPMAETLLGPLAERVPSGMAGVNWVCAGITAVALILFALTMTRRAEANKLRGEDEEKKARERAEAAKLPWSTRAISYFREGPFTNSRFVFFIFMLLPVQTLFAHQWLTMPLYIMRAYPEGVADRMEWLVNWTNPTIIFFGVPIATALTRRWNVYRMMIIGTTVSALPTFLLSLEPSLSMLISYLVLFSIGEALWQPRFLQYAAELAPEGKVAQYMGLANVPWITAKMTTGLYSGYMLSSYCPQEGVQDTQTMWFIYGIIALISPIGLILGRKWVMAGLDTTDSSMTAADSATK